MHGPHHHHGEEDEPRYQGGRGYCGPQPEFRGRHMRHPFFGPMMAHKARRGDVRAAVLMLLAEEPRNGYQLMQEIEARSNGVWRPSPGSMYPVLQQLVDQGFIEPSGEGGKLYAVTEAGRKHLEENRDLLVEARKRLYRILAEEGTEES